MDEESQLKVKMDAELKRKFDALIAEKKTNLTFAVSSMIRWLLAQEPLMQNIALGQFAEGDKRKVLKMMLSQMEGAETAAEVASIGEAVEAIRSSANVIVAMAERSEEIARTLGKALHKETAKNRQPPQK